MRGSQCHAGFNQFGRPDDSRSEVVTTLRGVAGRAPAVHELVDHLGAVPGADPYSG